MALAYQHCGGNAPRPIRSFGSQDNPRQRHALSPGLERIAWAAARCATAFVRTRA